MCVSLESCCFCISVEAGAKIISVLYTLFSICTLLVYAPLAALGELPQARFIFYATLSALAVLEVFVGGLLVHGAFERKPQFTWPWLILSWFKSVVLLVLCVAGLVALAFTRDLDVIIEASAVISGYIVYSAILLYFTSVVNSRRKELIYQNYWATKHLLRHAKNQYYYV